MDLRKALLDAAQHLLIPLNLQVRMQTALHQHAGAAQLHGLADFLIDRYHLQHVTFDSPGTFYWGIKSAEGAVFGAEVGVINVAIDDVSGHAFRMQLTAQRIGFHAQADQVVRAEQVKSLLFGQGHEHPNFSRNSPVKKLCRGGSVWTDPLRVSASS